MKNTSLITISMIVTTGILMPWAADANGQLWVQFAHPSNPHLDLKGPDVPITVPELLQTSADVTISVPVLLVLMDFNDVTHRAEHTLAFWEDLVFGNPRTGPRPSLAEIYQENTNGRLSLVPAVAGDVYDGNANGVVGWVATNQTYGQLYMAVHRKRAEGIRVADPFFDYHVYDDDKDGLITSDELLVLVVTADNGCCEMHHPSLGHSNPAGCVNCAGGNVRTTDPSKVGVQDPDPNDPTKVIHKQVYQHVAGHGEMSHVAVVAHEIGHSRFGLGDLYGINPAACSTYQQVTDGYTCNGNWYPPPPGEFSLMAWYSADYIPHLDPWAKIHLGFVKPLVVTHDGTYTLYGAETVRNFSSQSTQPEALIIYDPLRADPYKEYLILENRNKTQLNDQGMAVWLIDESTSDRRKVVRLVRRAGHWAQMNQALWDGVDDANGYDFTATSTPRNTNWTDGTKSYIEVYDISPAGPAMTFKVRMPPIFVDWNNDPLVEIGSQDFPFDEVDEAIAAIPEAPRTIRIAGGSYPKQLAINTACTLKGWRNGNAVIGQ